jgi:hypothetical protein
LAVVALPDSTYLGVKPERLTPEVRGWRVRGRENQAQREANARARRFYVLPSLAD